MTDLNEAERFWTAPNAVSLLRVLGLPPLLWAARQGHRTLFFGLVVALLLTDWIDGRLAAALHQRTAIGARLDSVADALFYGSVACSFWWLEESLIRAHFGWMAVVIASWSVSTGLALIRFGKIPSYHDWSAKLAWFVTASTILLLLLTDLTFVLPWALGLATFSNLHALAITCVLPRWQPDVWSLRQAWRIRRETP